MAVEVSDTKYIATNKDGVRAKFAKGWSKQEDAKQLKAAEAFEKTGEGKKKKEGGK